MAKGDKVEYRFKVMIVGAPNVGKTSASEWIFHKAKMDCHNLEAY